jgi:AraC-like DNA-binding protein
MHPTSGSPLRQSRSFDSWVEHCQHLIDDQLRDAGLEGDTLLDVVASLPRDLTEPQQERAGHLLARLFCQFVATLDRRLVTDFARGPSPGDEISEWWTATHRLAGLIVRASMAPPAMPLPTPPPRTDARAERALAEIDRHFTNPRFGLGAAARHLALSDCRLTQLLKDTTGRTFGAHLHHRRVAEARTLLNDSALSIKEVAGRVGYQSTTQLDRHFKKIVRSLPSAYRAASQRRRESRRPETAAPLDVSATPKLTHTKQQN